MIQFSRHILDNGLTVICHTDKSTPFVSVNVLYKVGSRNEQADKTGFAHLFEHLMFGGSTHIEDYDKHVQLAGGESNAYTTNDLTNYYTTIPASKYRDSSLAGIRPYGRFEPFAIFPGYTKTCRYRRIQTTLSE